MTAQVVTCDACGIVFPIGYWHECPSPLLLERLADAIAKSEQLREIAEAAVNGWAGLWESDYNDPEPRGLTDLRFRLGEIEK